MRFLAEREPEHDIALAVAPGVWRVVATNSGPMTYHGTNSYIVEGADGASVIDPGPDDPAHIAALVVAARGPIARILLTHGHHDHVAGAARLAAESGAPIMGFAPSIAPNVRLDHPLKDGDEVAGLRVLYTPGHAADHLCFATASHGLFTGDHVMAWSTSVVSPPAGDMAPYLQNLRRLLDRRDDEVYFPGHGPALEGPQAYVEALIAHRLAREQAVLAALGRQPISVEALREAVYAGISVPLRRAAERNLLGHLAKLAAEGRVRRVGALWAGT